MTKIKTKIFFLSLIFLFSFYFVSAVTWNIDYKAVNTNSSDYWDNLNTPADISILDLSDGADYNTTSELSDIYLNLSGTNADRDINVLNYSLTAEPYFTNKPSGSFLGAMELLPDDKTFRVGLNYGSQAGYNPSGFFQFSGVTGETNISNFMAGVVYLNGISDYFTFNLNGMSIESSWDVISFVDNDLTTTGDLNVTEIQTNDNSKILSIQPDADVTTQSVKLFENTTSRPQFSISGLQSSGTGSGTIREWAQYSDAYGRYTFEAVNPSPYAAVIYRDNLYFAEKLFFPATGRYFFDYDNAGTQNFAFLGLNDYASLNDNMQFVISDGADIGVNMGFPVEYTNPIVYITSGTPSAPTDEFISLQHDDSNAYIGVGKGDLYLNISGEDLIIANRSGGYGNVIATQYIEQSAVYDKSQGLALDLIKDADEWTTPSGSLNHTEHYADVLVEITDYSRPVEYEDCETILNEEKGIEEEYCQTKVNYPYTKQVDAVSLSERVATLEQAVFELKQRIEQLEATCVKQ